MRCAILICLAACGRLGFERSSEINTSDAGDNDAAGDIPVALCTGGCEATAFCTTQFGVCGGAGTCELRPALCPDLGFAVCGCDGVTYGNDCEARMAGASVAFTGECTAPYQPPCMPACSKSQYCKLNSCQGPGTCMAEPPEDQQCLDIIVCGCDGKMYGNSCAAYRAGVDVSPGGCAI